MSLTANNLPLTGGLAAACLFAVLLVKLMGDPDHNLREFRIVLGLEALGALLYFVPYVFGVQFNAVAPGIVGRYQQLACLRHKQQLGCRFSLRYHCPVCHHGSNSCCLHFDHRWPCRSPRGTTAK